jgi:lipopolysaccharide export system permease protein
MYTIMGERYLKMELFRGYNYNEGTSGGGFTQVSSSARQETLSKTAFDRSEIVFDLSSFDLKRTEKQLFQGNRIMRNMSEIDYDLDSITRDIRYQRFSVYNSQSQLFNYHLKRDSIPIPAPLVEAKKAKDSIYRARSIAGGNTYGDGGYYPISTVSSFVKKLPDSVSAYHRTRADSLFALPLKSVDITTALNHARAVKSQLLTYNTNTAMAEAGYREFNVQWHKILANSFACLCMFLIGAPLGAIIKKGGLGVPVLISILFFILFYVMGIMGDKWAKNDMVPVIAGVWGGNVVLFALGMVFLRMAWIDARLFDIGFYVEQWQKFKNWINDIMVPEF